MHGQAQEAMNKYLGPLLEAAQNFLRSGLPGTTPDSGDFPIYLLATGGMRLILKSDQNQILGMAYQLIKTFGKTFNADHPETTLRVILGDLEGLFS